MPKNTTKKPQKDWEEEFCERYQNLPPGLLAMIIVEIGEHKAEWESQAREEMFWEILPNKSAVMCDGKTGKVLGGKEWNNCREEILQKAKEKYGI